MEHVVFSAAVDGAGEEFRRVSSLEEAVRVVEHLRNDLGIEDASVFSLTAVPLAFRTYYRVEVPGVEMPGADAMVETAAPPLLAVPSLVSDAEPLLPLTLVSDAPESDDVAVDSYDAFSAIPSLEPVSAPAPLEPLESVSELSELADLVAASDEYAELPAMPGPGLQPRLSELSEARVEGESEHSLGYFTR
jgi:hypothetical protein